MNVGKITQKLEQLPLMELARQSRFIKSSRFQISPFAYVLGFMQMIILGRNTLELWAYKIASLTGHLISPQALQNRIQYPQVDFCKQLLQTVINQQLHLPFKQCSSHKLLRSFTAVYLEDSTCITLPKFLHRFFPGAVNQNGNSSSARIQLLMELLSGNYHAIELQSYRDNDQKHAPRIIPRLAVGDLLIRDLGYFVVDVFRQIHHGKAFFLSRFYFNTKIYDPHSGQAIDLAKHLRTLRKQHINTWDKKVLLGADLKVPVRIIAIKAPQQVEQQRKRKANRDRRANHSKEYLELLGWTILITNVEPNIWTPQQALTVYGFRWRIEIIFKCWKQHFELRSILKHKNGMSHPRVLITIYLLLVTVTMLFVQSYLLTMLALYQQTECLLSFLKFGRYLKDQQYEFDPYNITPNQMLMLERYFTQTKRKQLSQIEILYELKSS